MPQKGIRFKRFGAPVRTGLFPGRLSPESLVVPMKPTHPGWLFALLTEEVTAHRPAAAIERFAEKLPKSSRRSRARAYLRRVLRDSGLLFGTPAQTVAAAPGKAAEELLLFAVLRTFARIALDISVLMEAGPAPRREQLLLLFSALLGQVDEVSSISNWVGRPEQPLPQRSWSRVELALEQRAVSLAGDQVYGLLLHNGATYADAQVYGRQAIDYFARGALPSRAVVRRLQFAARQKALLIEVLAALTSVDRRPGFFARRAIQRQIDNLHLPADLRVRVRKEVRNSFAGRASLEAILQPVRSKDMRRFILEQTILVSLVDGRRGAREVAFIQKLSSILSMTQADLGQIEMEMAEFYARNRSVVDVFKVSAGAGAMGEQIAESIQRAVEKNFHRLIREIRQTGELSVLLTRAARGQKLTQEERKLMRTQLIDIAKAIPALAIFAAPGGMLLLIALAKVLPFSILPSAFQDDESGEDERLRPASKRADA